MIHNGRIAEIKLYKIVVTFPSFVPQTVIIGAVAVKVYVEPVFVRRVPFFLADITELREAPAYMIEYAVKNDLNAFFVKLVANLLEILVSTQTAVYFAVISCIVAVCIGFKYR